MLVNQDLVMQQRNRDLEMYDEQLAELKAENAALRERIAELQQIGVDAQSENERLKGVIFDQICKYKILQGKQSEFRQRVAERLDALSAKLENVRQIPHATKWESGWNDGINRALDELDAARRDLLGGDWSER